MDNRRRLPPSLLHRLVSAVGRRVSCRWQTFRYGNRPPLAESSLGRLLQTSHDAGFTPYGDRSPPCPGLTAALLPTLWSFGERELVARHGNQLIALQRSDGSLPDAELRHASRFNTAQAARTFALLALTGTLPAAESALRNTCQFLVANLDNKSLDPWAPEIARLCGLSTVVELGIQPDVVLPVVRRILRTVDITRHASSHPAALHGIETLLDLAAIEPRAAAAAKQCLDRAASLQRRDGSVVADDEAGWVSSAGLAHLAVLWYRTGHRLAADRALACLAKRQRADGSWPASWGRSSRDVSYRASTWTAKLILDASAAQVAAAFDGDSPGLDEPLTADDGRLAAVQAIVTELPRDAKVADVGCGPGRYLSSLSRQYPHLELTGIDPSPYLLKNICSATTVVGNLLRLPVDDGSFDVAICIEALEHALVPRRAVAELCRIVRPGGRVLIIDKNERFRSLSLCEIWERWFSPQSLVDALSNFCDDVTCTPLPPGPHRRTPGLFLAWQGVRRHGIGTVAIDRAA